MNSVIRKIQDAHQSQINAVQAELLLIIRACDPYQFERLVLSVLKKMLGWKYGRLTQRSGDRGVDGFVYQDAREQDAIPFQTKRPERAEKTVGSPVVRDFGGALAACGAKYGFLITSSCFTREAMACELVTQRRVILMNGEKLAESMYEHNIGVTLVDTREIKVFTPQAIELLG
jgi:restriction system protein